ncbi:hypothetical protein, partial [Ferrovum sp.]|uniref:hypothetical protein n=1 Tax=Ferrovum sp. TaxID=2609467 RepID=UPI00263877C0
AGLRPRAGRCRPSVPRWSARMSGFHHGFRYIFFVSLGGDLRVVLKGWLQPKRNRSRFGARRGPRMRGRGVGRRMVMV